MRKKLERWSQEELTYLIENYADTPTSVLARHLKRRTARNIYEQAKRFGLKKDRGARESSAGIRSTYREETPDLANIICFYDRRQIEVYIIARDTNCPLEQVEEILERCKTDGSYERYAKQENRALKLEPNMCLHLFETRGRKDSAAEFEVIISQGVKEQ